MKNEETVDEISAEDILEQLMEHVRQMRYGTCSVTITVHESTPVRAEYGIVPKFIWKQKVKRHENTDS